MSNQPTSIGFSVYRISLNYLSPESAPDTPAFTPSLTVLRTYLFWAAPDTASEAALLRLPDIR